MTTAGELSPFALNVAVRTAAKRVRSIFGDRSDVMAAPTSGPAALLKRLP